MNKKEFIETIVQDFQTLEGVEVSTSIVKKVNHNYTALTFRKIESSIGVNINMDGYYAVFKKGLKNLDFIKRDVLAKAWKAINNAPSINLDSLKSYEEMKEKLSINIISKKANKEVLKTIPYKELEDMALVYRIILNENENASILVTNEMLKYFGITADQLHEDALRIAPKNQPAQLDTLSNVLNTLLDLNTLLALNSDMEDDSIYDSIYVATTNTSNGASVIAYPGFLEESAKRMGNKNFFILPASIHECLFVKDENVNPDQLLDMVKSVNRTEVRPEDKLTDSVYYYDAAKSTFSKVA